MDAKVHVTLGVRRLLWEEARKVLREGLEPMEALDVSGRYLLFPFVDGSPCDLSAPRGVARFSWFLGEDGEYYPTRLELAQRLEDFG